MNTKRTKVIVIEAADLQRMTQIARRVWQYIGSDMEGETDNEAAVECCFDADRPLLCHNGDAAEAEADNLYMKSMYKKYTFHDCVRAVSRNVRLA